MNDLVAPCINHPRRETTLRCSKCERPICPSCAVQTPVGARCRQCANLRRLPQFDVSASLFARSVPAGLIASIVAWVIVSFVPYLRFFLAILVGAAVGEVMSRLAKRRVNHWLEAAAVLDVVAGLVVATAVLSGIGVGHLARALVLEPSLLLSFLLPAAVASLVAIVKMR